MALCVQFTKALTHSFHSLQPLFHSLPHYLSISRASFPFFLPLSTLPCRQCCHGDEMRTRQVLQLFTTSEEVLTFTFFFFLASFTQSHPQASSSLTSARVFSSWLRLCALLCTRCSFCLAVSSFKLISSSSIDWHISRHILKYLLLSLVSRFI